MKINYYKWKDLNFQDIYETKRDSTDNPEKSSVEEFEKDLSMLNRTYKRFFNSIHDPVGIIVHSDIGEPLGSLLLFFQSSKKIEVNPWELRGHPWIKKHPEKEKILSLLLENAVKYAEENGYTNIELSITKKDSNPDEYKNYEYFGFEFHHETTGMTIKLEKASIRQITIPEGFHLKQLNNIDPELLFKPYYETLKQNKTHYFYDHDWEECMNFFNSSIMKSDELKSQSSIVLLNEDRVVGFTFVMEYSSNFHFIDWIGVHPDYRGKGYGKLLMDYIVDLARKKGVKGMGLSCDVENEVAYELYKKIGFTPDEREITISWLKQHPKN